MAKRRWPLAENERARLVELFERLDAGRARLRDAKASGNEDAIDDAAELLSDANEAMLRWCARLTERSHTVYDDEQGWKGLGAPTLAATETDPWGKRMPSPFEADDWLVLGEASDGPERPEPEHVERYLRVLARTGWWGLAPAHRQWLERVRDDARELANAITQWLEATR